MSPVWIMKRGFVGQRADARDRLAQRRQRIRVRRLVEADVAVADLDEAEGLPRPARRRAPCRGRWRSARRPQASTGRRCRPRPCIRESRGGRCRHRPAQGWSRRAWSWLLRVCYGAATGAPALSGPRPGVRSFYSRAVDWPSAVVCVLPGARAGSAVEFAAPLRRCEPAARAR